MLIGGGAAAAAWLVPESATASHRFPGKGASRTIYRLSSRGRRASAGTKAHHANMRFRTRAAADCNRAHPGDHARIVPLTVSPEEYRRLFYRGNQVADLRNIDTPMHSRGRTRGKRVKRRRRRAVRRARLNRRP